MNRAPAAVIVVLSASLAAASAVRAQERATPTPEQISAWPQAIRDFAAPGQADIATMAPIVAALEVFDRKEVPAELAPALATAQAAFQDAAAELVARAEDPGLEVKLAVFNRPAVLSRLGPEARASLNDRYQKLGEEHRAALVAQVDAAVATWRARMPGEVEPDAVAAAGTHDAPAATLERATPHDQQVFQPVPSPSHARSAPSRYTALGAFDAWLERLLTVRDKPRTAYRGQTGPMLVATGLDDAQARSLRRAENLVREYNSSGKSFGGANSYSPKEVELIDYMTNLIESNRRDSTANFNLSRSQAREWALSSELHVYRGYFQSKGDWASELLERMSRFKIVLRADLPAGQAYWTDRFRDDDFGIMTHVPLSLLASVPPERLVERVQLEPKGKWYRAADPKVKPLVVAQFRFLELARSAILRTSENGSLDAVVEGVRRAYRDSGLEAAVAARQAGLP